MKEMLERLQNVRNNKKKGFTLVELIVVLVILAILAALLIPALTGYIDKAKEKQIIAETRQTVMAAQTIIDEQYATVKVGTTISSNVTIDGKTEINDQGVISLSEAEVKDLAEVSGKINSITVDGNAKITKLEYTNGNTCTYDGSSYTVGSTGNTAESN